MSQKKVEQYKKEKANRKQIMKKQKHMSFIRRSAAALVACAILAWAGFSMYRMHEAKQPRSVAEVDYDAINTYLTELGE